MKLSTPTPRLLRSALYMPASNPKAIMKARTLPVDAVILDLEDAVAPDAKETARGSACAAIREGGFGARRMIIRINAPGTDWHAADLAATVACAPDAILVPKINSAKDVLALDAALAAAPTIELWAMIETCASLANLFEIAALAKSTRLSTFVMGTNDLASEMRARLTPGRMPLQFALSLTISAARANGVDVLDGVHNDISDHEGFEEECRQGAMFGFDGKTLIHPKQIETCNRIYGPSEGEIAWSRLVIATFDMPENASLGAIQLQGRMVERLHLEQARRFVALAEATGHIG
jgi:citrate lyase subunit beta / citryl-CoA lyase